MAGTLSPNAVFTGLDDNGDPLSGGLLYTYLAGTSTPKATYTNVELSVANTNPIVLDAAGRATIYLLPTSYKFILKDSAGVTIWTQDNVSAVPGLSSPGFFAVTSYGAVGNGTTDDTSAISNAIAALNTAGGGTLYFGQGTFRVTAALTAINKNATIEGSHHLETIVSAEAGSGAYTLFTLEGTAGEERFAIRDINIVGPSSANYTGISVGKASFRTPDLYIDHLYIGGFGRNLKLTNCTTFVIDGSRFNGCTTHNQIELDNPDYPDEGDNAVSNTHFIDNYTTGAHFRHFSGGGIRFTNCKMNQADYGYVNVFDALSVIVLFSGCSIENQDVAGLLFAPTAGLHHVSITGCQFAVWDSSSGVPIKVAPGASGSVQIMTVNGCTLSGPSAGVGTSKGILLTEADGGTVDNVVIDGNVFSAFATGIDVASSGIGGAVIGGDNQFISCTADFANVSNATIFRTQGVGGCWATSSNTGGTGDYTLDTQNLTDARFFVRQATNTQVKILQPGRYLVTFQAATARDANGDAEVDLYQTAAVKASGYSLLEAAESGFECNVSGSAVIDAVIDDYVKLTLVLGTTRVGDADGHTQLSVVKV